MKWKQNLVALDEGFLIALNNEFDKELRKNGLAKSSGQLSLRILIHPALAKLPVVQLLRDKGVHITTKISGVTMSKDFDEPLDEFEEYR